MSQWNDSVCLLADVISLDFHFSLKRTYPSYPM